MRLTGILVALLLITSAPSLAADDAPQTRLDARTEALMKDLDENQLRQLAAIRESVSNSAMLSTLI